MSDRNVIADISWDEYARRIDAGAVVLVPVGANEQHGHHMSLGTDTVEVIAACREAARHADLLIAPAIPYGYVSQIRSSGGNHWPGNLSLEGDTLVRVVRDILRGLVRHGARRIAVVDSHFENGWFLVAACEQVANECAAAGEDVCIVKMMCWDAISSATWERVYDVSGPVDLSLAHAGVLETAAMLHAAPEQVDMDRVVDDEYVEFPPYDVFPQDPRSTPRTGPLSSPRGSTPELGRQILDDMGTNLARILTEAFDAHAAGREG